MSSVSTSLVAASVLVMSACSSGPQDPDALTRVVDSSTGVSVTRISGVPPTWALDTLYVVGSAGGMGDAAPDEFAGISAIALDGSGRLWVADQRAAEIRAFDAQGQFTGSIGRRGEGPGEFSSLSALAFVGDRLLTQDFGNARVGAFSLDGEWLGGRTGFGGLSGDPAWLRFHPLGDSMAVQFSMRRSDDGIQRLWVEHGRDSVLREFEQRSIPVAEAVSIQCDRPDGAISFFSAPYSPTVVQLPAGDGRAWVARSGDYRFALIGADNDTVRVIDRVRPPVPITDEEWAAGIQEFADFREEWPTATCSERGFERAANKSEFIRAIQDTAGRLWVEVWEGQDRAWEILTSDGYLLARVPGFDTAERVAPTMRESLIAWVSADELGIQRVVVARLLEN